VLPGELLGVAAPFGALRSDRIAVHPDGGGIAVSAGLAATVRLVEYQGAQVQVHLAGPQDQPIDVHLSDAAFEGAPFEPGAAVMLSWLPRDVRPLQ